MINLPEATIQDTNESLTLDEKQFIGNPDTHSPETEECDEIAAEISNHMEKNNYS